MGWKQQAELERINKAVQPSVQALIGGKAAKGGKGAKGGQGSDLACSCCQKAGHRVRDCTFQHEQCKTCNGYGHRQFSRLLAGGAAANLAQKGAEGGKAATQAGGKGPAAPTDAVSNCCGKAGHVKPVCRKKGEACGICGKIGHLKAVCSKRDKSLVTGTPAPAASTPAGQAAAWRAEWSCANPACKATQHDAETTKCNACGAKREGKEDTPKAPKHSAGEAIANSRVEHTKNTAVREPKSCASPATFTFALTTW